MKHAIKLFAGSLIFAAVGFFFAQRRIQLTVTDETEVMAQIEKTFDLAEQKIGATLVHLDKHAALGKTMPRSTLPDGSWSLLSADDPEEWTAGFFPGCLWQIYEARKTRLFDARKFTYYLFNARAPMKQPPPNGNLHADLGFDMTNSYLNMLLLDKTATNDTTSQAVLLRAAKDLKGIYNEKAGAIIDREAGRVSATEFYVPVDYIMNLQPLFWAAKNQGSMAYREIALSHATTTMNLHIRPDGGTWHHVIFREDGKVSRKVTYQGHSDSSTWSRGQAWAIYGFTVAYRESRQPKFLATAEKLANYFLSRLPADHIPPWDFDDPSPKKPKDSSAAAIAASGLIELSRLAESSALKERYMRAARNILIRLMHHYVDSNPSHMGILQHGVGNFPRKKEIGVSLIYGDYYFLEALNRYKRSKFSLGP